MGFKIMFLKSGYTPISEMHDWHYVTLLSHHTFPVQFWVILHRMWWAWSCLINILALYKLNHYYIVKKIKRIASNTHLDIFVLRLVMMPRVGGAGGYTKKTKQVSCEGKQCVKSWSLMPAINVTFNGNKQSKLIGTLTACQVTVKTACISDRHRHTETHTHTHTHTHTQRERTLVTS